MLTLKIITQERKLLEEQVESVSVPSVQGELTILPQHVPLFTKLQTGELVYRINGKEHFVVLTDGFMDVAPGDVITVMVDSAIRSDEINVLKAEEAKKRAEEMMTQQLDQRDFIMAESSLRRAMMEIQVFNKRRNTRG